jgi:hypothetical protein
MRQKIQTWKIHLFIIITRTLKPHHCNTDRIPLRTELCPDRPPLPCLPPSIVFLPLSSSSFQPNLHAPYLHTASIKRSSCFLTLPFFARVWEGMRGHKRSDCTHHPHIGITTKKKSHTAPVEFTLITTQQKETWVPPKRQLQEEEN